MTSRVSMSKGSNLRLCWLLREMWPDLKPQGALVAVGFGCSFGATCTRPNTSLPREGKASSRMSTWEDFSTSDWKQGTEAMSPSCVSTVTYVCVPVCLLESLHGMGMELMKMGGGGMLSHPHLSRDSHFRGLSL